MQKILILFLFTIYGLILFYSGSNSPVIPKTPASLAPFIYKINEPWTSELETPEAKLATKLQNSSVSAKIITRKGKIFF